MTLLACLWARSFAAPIATFGGPGQMLITGSVSAEKYEGYGEYQSSTQMLLPAPRSLAGR